MSLDRSTNYGTVNISTNAIAAIVGGAATECYGVVGMASKALLKDGFAELLKKENISKGIIIKENPTGIEIEMYLILGYGMKITEIVNEVAKKVKYTLKNTLNVNVENLTIYVQGIKIVE